MRLSKLDLLTIAPKNIIFGNYSNKTNFGGFLTLVLLIIVLIIFAYYLIIFITEADYSIQYARFEKYLTRDEINERPNDIRYNPYLMFYFDLVDIFGNTLSEDFLIFNSSSLQFIPRKEYIKKRVTDFTNLKILYKCNNSENVSNYDECIAPVWLVKLFTYYSYFKLDHQNSTSPLYVIEQDKFLGYYLRFLPDQTRFITEKWENVKYNPEAGLTKLWKNLNGVDNEQQKYIGIKQSKTDSTINPYVDPIYIFNNTKYRFMGMVEYEVDFNHYDEYTRTKKSFLVLISNVFSLSLGIFKFLRLFLTIFYSNNFDNYKIVEKLFYDIKPVKIELTPKIKLNKSSINENSLLDKNERSEDSSNYDEENKSIENEDIIHDINESEKEGKGKMILPKFRFIDFLFNNLCCNKICKNKRQEIITNCNKLINKYYSIENILYNQIKIERLLKDYKWNNEELANINNNNNELIYELNNSISCHNSEEND